MKDRLCHHWILLFVITLLSGHGVVSAQISNQVLFNDQESIQKISKGGGGYFAASPVSEGIEGSPLLFSWQPAKVYIKNQSVGNYLVSYNASSDLFLMRGERSRIWEVDDEQIDSIIAIGKNFVAIDGGYFQLLSGRGIQFLKKYKAEVQNPNYIPALNTGTKTKSWQMATYYYIRMQSGIKQISLTKKSIQKALGLSKDFINQMEDRGLKFNTESDVIVILAYFEMAD